MKKLLTILCLFLLSSYSYSKEVSCDRLVERQGIIYKVNSTTPFTGRFMCYDGYETIKVRFKNGKPEGLWERFYDNGQLQSRENYKNGEPVGLFEYYHENGQLQSRENYKNGEPVGLKEVYHENGQLQSRGNFKEGKMDGMWEGFYSNGTQDEYHPQCWENGELVKYGHLSPDYCD